MKFDTHNSSSDATLKGTLNFPDFFEKYLPYLKWFLLSIFLCVVFAFIKLKFEPSVYEVSASILVKDSDRGNSITDISGFESLGLVAPSESSLENEIEFLKSRRLMTKVAQDLNLNFKIFLSDSPIDEELFLDHPIRVSFPNKSEFISQIEDTFYLEVLNSSEFELFNGDEERIGVRKFGQVFEMDLSTSLESYNKFSIRIDLEEAWLTKLNDRRIRINLSSMTSTVNNLMERLEVELPVDQRYSRVLKIYFKDTKVERGKAVLSNLIAQYNLDGIEDSDEIAKSTTEFLEDRLILLSNEIKAIETSAAQFKSNRMMVDPSAGTSVYLQSSSVNESDLVELNTQLQIVDYISEELKNSNSGEILPSNIGVANQNILNLVSEYNSLVLRRKRIMDSSSDRNPIVVNLDTEMAALRENLDNSLSSYRSSLQIQIEALIKRRGNISSKIAAVPKYEQEFNDIVRDQETKNALYLFLLQKREESILSNAVQINKAKIIEPPYSDGNIVHPKKIFYFLIAFLVGFFIPFMIVYIRELFDTKVHDVNDVKSLDITYLGDIPYLKSKNELKVITNDNSPVSEAFRYVRTNINFLLLKRERGNVILVTSTQSGEGKTFTSFNLSQSLSAAGNRTVLLGLDLRAPRVKSYMDQKTDHPGVSHFIMDKSLVLSDIVNKRNEKRQFDIIEAGEIPPNPVELLMQDRVEKLFEELREKYDFIVVDTAPVGMVTDTLQISKYADLTVYIVKANYLDKRMLHIPANLNRERKLPNMSILLNATEVRKGAYGYGYGYTYGSSKPKPWHERILNRAAF